jgi:DNA (cytosine-5)-methyltransferase 1
LETIRPRWFVGENVAGHVTMGLDDVLSDLGDIGYTAQSFIIPACGVGAVHRRDRVFVLAYTDSKRVYSSKEHKDYRHGQEGLQQRIDTQSKLADIFKVSANTNSKHEERVVSEEVQRKQALQGVVYPGGIEEWNERSVLFEPKLLRNYHGISDGMERIKALGNAVVPQQIYPILAAIKQIDDMIKEEIA